MAKSNFFCVKLRKIYIFIILSIIILSLLNFFAPKYVQSNASPKNSYKIVLDAGHGGIDVGAVGVGGTKESELNLSYALTLKEQLTKYGFDVKLTRENENGLYSQYKSGFKLEDMKMRREIIENENPDIFVSIHQNKFSSTNSFGPQIFYQPKSENSRILAQSVQDSLMKNLDTKNRPLKEGDFYVLNGNSCPSILIECGFLSNPNEEALLIDKTYRENFCYYVICGIFAFLA